MEKSSRSLTLSIYMLQHFQWLSMFSNCTSLPLQRHWNTNACAKSSYVFSAFVDRHHGTPMLLEGVRCIGVELEYDSEQSDWQGFDWFNVTLVCKVRTNSQNRFAQLKWGDLQGISCHDVIEVEGVRESLLLNRHGSVLTCITHDCPLEGSIALNCSVSGNLEKLD